MHELDELINAMLRNCLKQNLIGDYITDIFRRRRVSRARRVFAGR
jgi:hypothetical protein